MVGGSLAVTPYGEPQRRGRWPSGLSWAVMSLLALSLSRSQEKSEGGVGQHISSQPGDLRPQSSTCPLTDPLWGLFLGFPEEPPVVAQWWVQDRAGLSLLSSSLQFVLKNYGENPENYNEELRKLEQLRQVSQAPAPLEPARARPELVPHLPHALGCVCQFPLAPCISGCAMGCSSSSPVEEAFCVLGSPDDPASQGVHRGWMLGLSSIRFPQF